MDNSNNIRIYPTDRANLLDPNYGKMNVPLENLNISVELFVMERPRSFINVIDDEGTQLKKIAELKDGASPFFKGTKIDGEFSLTTNYTDVDNMDASGDETLGITSINIEFNSAYMPLISMQMVDVRGRMHEMGTNSPYNAFFNFPYPIFKLVVKGYYGQPVEYILHLTKFNSSMDSGKGNFNISLDFQGYTYSYLSDMLIGYLKAVPYTTEGRKFTEIKRAEDDNFVSFDELYEYAKILNKDILKLKQNDEDVQSLALGQNKLNEILTIKQGLLRELKDLDAYSWGLLSRTGDFVLVKPEPLIRGRIKTKIETTKKNIEKLLEGEKLLNPLLYKLDNNNYIKGVKIGDFLTENGEIRENYVGTIGNELFNNPTVFRNLSRSLQTITEKNNNIKFDVLYLKDVFDDLNNGIDTLREHLKKSKISVSEKFFRKIENLTIVDANGNDKQYDFNIKNYIKVLCDHVDILMNTIRSVSLKAEDDSIRNRDLKADGEAVIDVHGDKQNIEKIYAFPDYRKNVQHEFRGMFDEPEKNITSLEDVWIGSDYPNIDEAIFVRELYDGMVRSKQEEKNYETYLTNMSSQWYGINPFDSLLYTGGYSSPWESVSNSNGKDINIIRLMVMRALIFMVISTRQPTNQEIKAMARLEANNLFNTIKNPIAKTALNSYVNENNINQTSEYIINLIKGDESSLEISLENKPLLRESGNDNLTYLGIIDTNIIGEEPMDEDGNVKPLISSTFLPLYFSGNRNDYDGSTIETNGDVEKRKMNREKGDIIFSKFGGSQSSTIDYGETLIDIINLSDYNKNYVNDVSYAPRIINDTKINNSLTLNTEHLKSKFKDILFNGRFNSNEFTGFTDNEHLPFYLYFYENETSDNDTPMFMGPRPEGYEKTLYNVVSEQHEQKYRRGDARKTITGLLRDDNKSLPHINYYGPNPGLWSNVRDAQATSLFGSEFYYNQTNNYGRAFLFLHTIPFKGMNSDNANSNTILNKDILNIFNQKAGFVEVPYTWILFIGGLLYREGVEEIISFKNGDVTVLPTAKTNYGYPARGEYLKTRSHHDRGFNFDSKNKEYKRIEGILTGLPDSVKIKFINEFTNWVDGGEWDRLRGHLEIFTEESTMEERKEYWFNFRNRFLEDPEELLSESIINGSGIINYININSRFPKELNDIGPNTLTLDWITNTYVVPERGCPFHFDLELRDNSEAVTHVIELLNKSKIVVNGSWRTWTNTLDEDDISNNIVVKKSDLENYIQTFFTEFNNLQKDVTNSEDEVVFDTTDNDDIYLTIYKNIKSIKDKWINNHNESGLPFDNLIETFNFIDRGYNDIGEIFKINPLQVSSLLSSNQNVSLYSHISKVLTNNNFDFIAMPNYINYSQSGNLESVFKTYSYGEVVSQGPSFVCMYIGERSNVLDDNKYYPNDSFSATEDGGEIPNDFRQVPFILVRYGDENQSIFKDIELDQSEFSETNESIMTTDQIASSYNNINSIGQNMYNVYVNRAYNSKVEMMGNAMIQPFMYYQLDNIPMFRGAYVITKVSHNITPNHMTTKITGNRVKKARTKFLDKVTIFNNLIGNFGDIETGDMTFTDVMEIDNNGTATIGSNRVSNEAQNLPVLTSNNNPSIYVESFVPKSFESDIFEGKSNTLKNGSRMTYNEIFKEVSNITKIPVLSLKTMSMMESNGGTHPLVVRGVPNGSGFVGHMQFGLGATETIKNNVNSVIFTTSYTNYTFGAIVDYENNKLVIPPKAEGSTQWVKDIELNNKDTNSLYDDYINILAAGFLAKRNLDYLNVPYNHVADIYLSHQQGSGGLAQIKRDPLGVINNNAKNNLPPKGRDVKINQDWYLSWAAHVEATAKSIDDNFKLVVGIEDEIV